MLKKKQASKPRKQVLYRCCAADQSTDGQYQSTGGKVQSTGGSDQSTDSPQEHCAGTVHRSSRLMFYPRVWAVDCIHSQSTAFAQFEAISRLVVGPVDWSTATGSGAG